jgi:hypothetical protein
VASKPHKGTTFTVIIPDQTDAEKKAAENNKRKSSERTDVQK